MGSSWQVRELKIDLDASEALEMSRAETLAAEPAVLLARLQVHAAGNAATAGAAPRSEALFAQVEWDLLL